MDCLKGEFDVEPGDGGSRCDYLDEKGIETYLVIASKPEVKKTATQNGLNGSKGATGDMSVAPRRATGLGIRVSRTAGVKPQQ
ncbi:Adenylate cyclase type 3 [Saguinus oedipus]|uniref:Adenylate cyclase type 3 n=1 Tax=Saguinus oedipus TaxID=9490 RepID=A0ABQ9U5P1_SAGOE|nr:Adenylate cyclase type 3 [Saguinus oedipus]